MVILIAFTYLTSPVMHGLPASWRRFLSALCAACCLFALSSVAAAQQVGQVVRVIGKVEIQRAEQTTLQPLLRRAPIYLDDTVITHHGSQVKLLLNDNSILKIAPQSRLTIDQRLAGLEKQTTINLLKGRLRSVIGKKLAPSARFEVKTKVAVAGVRGTDFEVWLRTDDETLVRTYEGIVTVRNILDSVSGEVLVRPNTYSVIQTGATPSTPLPIAPGQALPASTASVKQKSQNNSQETTGEPGSTALSSNQTASYQEVLETSIPASLPDASLALPQLNQNVLDLSQRFTPEAVQTRQAANTGPTSQPLAKGFSLQDQEQQVLDQITDPTQTSSQPDNTDTLTQPVVRPPSAVLPIEINLPANLQAAP